MISRVLKKDIKFLITLFIVWKIWVIVFLLFAVVFIPLRLHFLGGGLEHYLRLPWFWAWGNFDGEHYLAIAQHGYGNGEQAFFPLYPVLMRLLVWPFRGDVYFLQAAGLFISNFAFFLTLLGLWKLVRLDFKKSIAELTIILLLAFPTSFYFGSVYTESLFFALIVWSFYAARRGWWLLSGILGGLSTATRFLGIILLPVLMIEWFIQRKNHKSPASRQGGPVTNHQSLFLFFIPLGLFTYMYYLYQTTGDPFAFFHTLTGFGEQRSSTPILLLQVFWRYFKITMDINIRDPFFFTFLLEAGTAILFLIAAFFSFFKLRLSYALWLLGGYLLPTLSGSFSSLPRYVLPLFPAFVLAALLLEKQPWWMKATVLVGLFGMLGIAMSLFVRGYWIA